MMTMSSIDSTKRQWRRGVQGGDLRHALTNSRTGDMQWQNKGAIIALDIVRGLHYLHSHGVSLLLLLLLYAFQLMTSFWNAMNKAACSAALPLTPSSCSCWLQCIVVYLQTQSTYLPDCTMSLQVMHMDLKPSNVLLTQTYSIAKIGDVGLAQVMGSSRAGRPRPATFAYSAPELILNSTCTEKVSLGVELKLKIGTEAQQYTMGHVTCFACAMTSMGCRQTYSQLWTGTINGEMLCHVLQVDMYSFGVILWELITTEVARRGRLRAIQVCMHTHSRSHMLLLDIILVLSGCFMICTAQACTCC